MKSSHDLKSFFFFTNRRKREHKWVGIIQRTRSSFENSFDKATSPLRVLRNALPDSVNVYYVHISSITIIASLRHNNIANIKRSRNRRTDTKMIKVLLGFRFVSNNSRKKNVLNWCVKYRFRLKTPLNKGTAMVSFT